MKKAMLLALLLILSLAFPLWTHTLAVEVKDSSGTPLPNIKISAVFQNRDPASSTDGYAEGYTGRDGKISLSLSNSVPVGTDKTAYAISASAPFFPEQKKDGSAVSGQDSSAKISFTIAGTYAIYKVSVVDKDGRAVSGAKVVLRPPYAASQQTGADGMAQFTLPQSADVEFYVSAGGAEVTLTNSDVQRTPEGNLVLARLDASFATAPVQPPANPAEGFRLDLQILDQKKVPIQGLDVTYKIPNLKEKSIKTDKSGKISILPIRASPVTISFFHSGYLFKQDIPVKSNLIQIVQIPTLLNITSVSVSQSDNCFSVRVEVSDPREEKISAYGLFVGADKQKPVSFNPSDEHVFAGDFCATASGKLTVFASNQYDTVSASKDLIIAGSAPGEIPGEEKNETALKQEQDRQTRDKSIIVLVCLSVLAFCGALFMFRKPLEYYSRSAIQYIRKLLRV
jgi:hypothetical protein